MLEKKCSPIGIKDGVEEASRSRKIDLAVFDAQMVAVNRKRRGCEARKPQTLVADPLWTFSWDAFRRLWRSATPAP